MAMTESTVSQARRAAALDWVRQGIEHVRVTATARAALLGDLEARLAGGIGFTLATLNLDHVVKIGRDADFRTAYARHSHVTADGNPVVWLSRLAGQEVDLVPGSELIEPLAEIAARHDVPVAMIGATEETLAEAAEELAARHPGLRVVARVAPPMGFDAHGADGAAAIEALRESGARLCFLALGAPRQEVFAARAADELPQVGFLSIGAGLDFLAGTQVRAPKVMRRFAAEWVWRLGSNPRRLAGRYGACLAVLPDMTLRALRHRYLPKSAS